MPDNQSPQWLLSQQDQKFNTIGGWATLLAHGLEDVGFDANTICAEHDIDLFLARDPSTRFSCRKMGLLWKHAVTITENPAFGLHAGTFITPTTLHALSLSMWLSATLQEAYERFARYLRIFSTTAECSLIRDGDTFTLCVDLYTDEKGIPYVSDEALDATFSALISLNRQLHRKNSSPKEIYLKRQRPLNTAPYTDFFNCPVHFGDRWEIIFDAKDFTQAVGINSEELLMHTDQVLSKYLSRLDKDDIIERVRVVLTELLPAGEPSREKVAFILNMSLRNMQRKLSARDTSYKNILNQLREELATQYLRQSHLSVSEVGYMLGFSSPNNFGRAFRRWLDMSPQQYKEQNQ